MLILKEKILDVVAVKLPSILDMNKDSKVARAKTVIIT